MRVKDIVNLLNDESTISIFTRNIGEKIYMDMWRGEIREINQLENIPYGDYIVDDLVVAEGDPLVSSSDENYAIYKRYSHCSLFIMCSEEEK